jgi:hypothetical protein
MDDEAQQRDEEAMDETPIGWSAAKPARVNESMAGKGRGRESCASVPAFQRHHRG